MRRQLTNKKLEELRRGRDHWRNCATEKQRFQENKGEAWEIYRNTEVSHLEEGRLRARVHASSTAAARIWPPGMVATKCFPFRLRADWPLQLFLECSFVRYAFGKVCDPKAPVTRVVKKNLLRNVQHASA